MGLFDRFRKKDDLTRELDELHERQGTAPQAPVSTGGASFRVDDVFTITGRGVVVTGKVIAGIFSLGDRVGVYRNGAEVAQTAVAGIEAFRKIIDRAEAGDHVGLLLRGIERAQVRAEDEIRSL